LTITSANNVMFPPSDLFLHTGSGDSPADKPAEEPTKSEAKKFEVERKEIRDEKTGELIDTQITIIINNRNLRDYLRGEIANDEVRVVCSSLLFVKYILACFSHELVCAAVRGSTPHQGS
jgi:hypothetical protein